MSYERDKQVITTTCLLWFRPLTQCCNEVLGTSDNSWSFTYREMRECSKWRLQAAEMSLERGKHAHYIFVIFG